MNNSLYYTGRTFNLSKWRHQMSPIVSNDVIRLRLIWLPRFSFKFPISFLLSAAWKERWVTCDVVVVLEKSPFEVKATATPHRHRPIKFISPHYLLSYCRSFQPLMSSQTSLLMGAWQLSGLDYWSLIYLLPIQHTEDLSTMRAEATEVVTNSGLMYYWVPKTQVGTSKGFLPLVNWKDMG